MLIEQIIEFELRWPGPCSRTYTLATGYFHDKTTMSTANLRVDYLQLKYCWRQCTSLFLLGPNHLQNLTPKCKILHILWIKL